VLDMRSNPDPSKLRFQLKGLVAFLWNIVPWIRYDFLRSRPGAMLTRLWIKGKTVAKRILGLFHQSEAASRKADVGTLFVLSHLPKEYVNLLNNHYQALLNYVPRRCAARITLFRARAQALFGFQPFDLGWGELAAGGVDIHDLPGSHDERAAGNSPTGGRP
jgi:hypothetical protein